MEAILREIERALSAQLWYAAIVLTVTLPDICASLEARPNARPDGQRARYKSWYNKHASAMLGLSADDCWNLRCGVVHEGRYSHKGMKGNYERVAFTLPDGAGVHNIVLQTPSYKVLSLHLPIFCQEMMDGVRVWFEKKRNDPVVQVNLERLVQVRPNGYMPYINGPNIIR